MIALTELLGTPVRASSGDEVGRVRDVVVRLDGAAAETPGAEDVTYPPVIGLVITGEVEPADGDGDECFVSLARVRALHADGVELSDAGADLPGYTPAPDELGLRSGLLDRYVVDVAHVRLVRVNDVMVEERGGVLRLVAVDAGSRALMRRLGVGALGQRVLARLAGAGGQPQGPLDWAQVIPLPTSDDADEPSRALARPKIAALDRLDRDELARLVGGLPPRQAAALLEAGDARLAAAAIEELDDERQAHVLRAMHPERAADVLDEMDPDEATDALQALREVDTAEADDLLGRMERDEAADVRELFDYPADTAGGLMTTEYVAVPGHVAAGDVLAALREREKAALAGAGEPVPEVLADVYVVEERAAPTAGGGRPIPLEAEGRLEGIVGLRELVLADPAATLQSLMREVDAVAHPLDDARDVARAIADADVVALPVVDDDGQLLGIVTVDDAIDVILPAPWRPRPSRGLH